MSGSLADLASVPKHTGGAPASIVVVAKCPIPGSSKTRLIPTLGAEGAAKLAEAMLADVLTTVSGCKELEPAEKVLLFAPPDDSGRDRMLKLLRDYGIVGRWVLQPVRSKNHDLKSSQLSHILQEALRVQRRHTRIDGPVVFLGMDSPEVPLNELVASCFHTTSNQALLCPAADGGYGLLCVPGTANPRSCFANVQWSHPLTALSQMKALTDQGISVTLGPLMYDIDDGDDLDQLCQRLRGKDASADTSTSLAQPSSVSFQLSKQRCAILDDTIDDDDNLANRFRCHASSPSATTSWFTTPITPSPKKTDPKTHHTTPCNHTRKVLVALKKLEEQVVPPKQQRHAASACSGQEEGLGSASFPSCTEGTSIGSSLLDDLKAVWTFS